jgi:head-tail adaptor
MRPVTLSRRLVLETPQMASDGAGGFTQVWASLGTLWGEVRAGSGREAAGEEISRARVTYRITLRGAPVGSTARPKPEQRLRDGARIFTILAVSEAEAAGLYLTCIATEELPT